MAEDFGDKTEAPTPRRREEAREEGQVARSPDLTAAAVLIGTFVLLNWYGPALVQTLRSLVADMLSARSLSDLSPAQALTATVRCTVTVGAAFAPILLGVIIIAVMVNIAQVGLHLTTKRLEPNLEALNPVKGFGRLFGGGRGGGMQALMSLLKLALVSFAAYSAVSGRLREIIGAQQLNHLQIFSLGAGIIYAIAIRIGLVLLVLALIDYGYQRYRLEQQLRMTKQEVKEEMRRMEGDPALKQRRRQIATQLHMQRLKNDVPKADVVVTNPTHFAVALQYDKDAMHAPKVIAKGRDLIALRIREIAIEHGIPIIERKPLARALYKLCDVGQEIPEQFYATVAEILAYVYELTGKLKRKQAV